MSRITKERKMFSRNDENKVSVFNVISDETEKVRVRALSSSDYVARCLKSEKSESESIFFEKFVGKCFADTEYVSCQSSFQK